MQDLNITDDLIYNYQRLIDDKTVFHEISYIDFYKEMNNRKDSLIYIGRPTCPVCVKFLPILHDILTAKKMRIEYFNVDNFFKDTSSDKASYISFFQELNISQLPSLIFTTGNMDYKRLPIYTIKTPINAWITAISDEFISKISNSHQQVEMVNIVIFQKLGYIAQVDERDFDVAGLADILKHYTRTNFLS